MDNPIRSDSNLGLYLEGLAAALDARDHHSVALLLADIAEIDPAMSAELKQAIDHRAQEFCVYCLQPFETAGRAACSWSDHCHGITCSETCLDCGRGLTEPQESTNG